MFRLHKQLAYHCQEKHSWKQVPALSRNPDILGLLVEDAAAVEAYKKIQRFCPDPKASLKSQVYSLFVAVEGRGLPGATERNQKRGQGLNPRKAIMTTQVAPADEEVETGFFPRLGSDLGNTA